MPGAPMAEDEKDGVWERGWTGHAEAQLLRLAALPLAQKLDWLEQAQRLATSLRKPEAERPEGVEPPE